MPKLKPRVKIVAKIQETLMFDDIFESKKVEVDNATKQFKNHIEKIVFDASSNMTKKFDPSMTKVSFDIEYVGYYNNEYDPVMTIWFQRLETDEEVQKRVEASEKARETRRLKREQEEMAKLEKEKRLFLKLKKKFEDAT